MCHENSSLLTVTLKYADDAITDQGRLRCSLRNARGGGDSESVGDTAAWPLMCALGRNWVDALRCFAKERRLRNSLFAARVANNYCH